VSNRWYGRLSALGRGPAVVVAVTLGLAALVGCGAPRGGYAAAKNVCSQVLPVAQSAVHTRGKLVQVRPVGRRELTELFPQAPIPSPTASPSPRPMPRACLVVYQGPYAAGSITGTTTGGRFAVIAVDVRGTSVLGVRTADSVPSQRPRPPSPSPTPSPVVR